MLELFTVSRTVVGTDENWFMAYLSNRLLNYVDISYTKHFIIHFTLLSATAKKSMTTRI